MDLPPTYLRTSVLILRTFVCYPLSKNLSQTIKTIFSIWHIIFLIGVISVNIQIFTYFISPAYKFMKNPFFIVEMLLNQSLFFYLFVANWKAETIQSIVSRTNSKFVFQTDNQIEDINMKNTIKFSDIFAILWPIGGFIAVILKTTAALWVDPGTLPLKVNFPYDWSYTPVFQLTCFWIYLTQGSVAMQIAATDAFYPSVTLLIYQQYKILRSNFKYGFFDVLIRCGLSKQRVFEFKEEYFSPTFPVDNESGFQDVLCVINSRKFRELNMENLKRNIQHHQMLLDHCKEVNDFFSILLITKVCCNFCYGILMFFSLLVAKDAGGMVESVSYTAAGTIQLCIYSYAGQILTNGADIIYWIYESPWYLCDVPYQKMFVMVQMRSLKVIVTKAGGYYAMSAQSFILFLKSIFSYVTVLRATLK